MYDYFKQEEKTEEDGINQVVKFITHTVIKVSRKI